MSTIINTEDSLRPNFTDNNKHPLVYFDSHLTDREFQEYLAIKKDLENQTFFKYRIDRNLKFITEDFNPAYQPRETDTVDPVTGLTRRNLNPSYLNKGSLLLAAESDRLQGKLQKFEQVFESETWKKSVQKINQDPKLAVEEQELLAYQAKYQVILNRYNFLRHYFGYKELLARLKKARKKSGYHLAKMTDIYARTVLALEMAYKGNPEKGIPPSYEYTYLLNSVKNWDHSIDYMPLGECDEAINILYLLNRFHGYKLDPNIELAIKNGLIADEVSRDVHFDDIDSENKAVLEELDSFYESDIDFDEDDI